jgi:predicted nucleic acid-binding protein
MELNDGDYLFDTSVFIGALRKNVVAQKLFHEATKPTISIGYSIITEMELWVGLKLPWTIKEHETLLSTCRGYDLT